MVKSTMKVTPVVEILSLRLVSVVLADLVVVDGGCGFGLVFLTRITCPGNN
jgi:hypothetical protein